MTACLEATRRYPDCRYCQEVHEKIFSRRPDVFCGRRDHGYPGQSQSLIFNACHSVDDVAACFAQGNKGATAIRVAFTPPPSKTVPTPAATTLTFVNSHLAAFDDMMEKRNSDFHEISKRMSFFADPVQPAPAVSSLPLSLYESDVLFWLVRSPFP
jgi:hypothetical protein